MTAAMSLIMDSLENVLNPDYKAVTRVTPSVRQQTTPDQSIADRDKYLRAAFGVLNKVPVASVQQSGYSASH
jgi:hypothetical protein